MYKLIDSTSGEIVCSYKAKTIALRDCEAKNIAARCGRYKRYYVLKPSGGKVTA